MTDVGTPRNETLIVQTFDGRSSNATQMNPLNRYAHWRGFRELGWSYLWEMDTSTGESYPELADGFPEVLNDDHTKFRIKIREGVHWSDGEEFTTDDIIFSIDTAFKYRDKLTNVTNYVTFLKDWKKIDDYTFEVETQKPSYDFLTRMGVYTWGSHIVWLPEHVLAPLGDEIVTYNNEKPVLLGPYTVKEYDPNGFWQLWEKRDDWERSGWGNLVEPTPKYILYKDFGTEETRSLAFVQNQYDIDTFMSPDTIEAAQRRNPAIETFAPVFPFHDMNDACGWGVYFNLQKSPYDMKELRWALALSLDLQQVGISALNGQFKSTALPVADTPVTRPIFHEPMRDFLKNLTLDDGYKPFDTSFNQKLVKVLAEQGVDPEKLPEGDGIVDSFGFGWWKHDPAEAEKLLASVGIERGSDGFYALPDGSPMVLEFVYPADWNKILQRLGFSIADSWRQAGFNINARQVDNGEFNTYMRTNARFQMTIAWNQQCVFNANWRNNWRQWSPEFVLPADSTDADQRLDGNYVRITDPRIYDLVATGATVPTNDPKMAKLGRDIQKIVVEEMYMLPLMSIPTTIPTNSTYWTNYTKADNFYALPYSWWSSFKKTVVNIEPSGK
ncbi:ABC transporter substrate-binding protein [Labrenzia sp. OB1]|uniref:ABC transporter substrate-binding protein n=1 Tax=Labrenzia sp. OB1 TaxID=1561204 RepID=UPI0018FE739A|nr:ABC transporter substrate-binding protein [Labrenzia sp. OB1]